MNKRKLTPIRTHQKHMSVINNITVVHVSIYDACCQFNRYAAITPSPANNRRIYRIHCAGDSTIRELINEQNLVYKNCAQNAQESLQQLKCRLVMLSDASSAVQCNKTWQTLSTAFVSHSYSKISNEKFSSNISIWAVADYVTLIHTTNKQLTVKYNDVLYSERHQKICNQFSSESEK